MIFVASEVKTSNYPALLQTQWKFCLLPQIVLKQMERDNNIISLAEAMDDAWAFVKEAEPLSQMNSRTNIINHLAQQTTHCGYFISAYCGNKSCKQICIVFASSSVLSHTKWYNLWLSRGTTCLEALLYSDRSSHSSVWTEIHWAQSCFTGT